MKISTSRGWTSDATRLRLQKNSLVALSRCMLGGCHCQLVAPSPLAFPSARVLVGQLLTDMKLTACASCLLGHALVMADSDIELPPAVLSEDEASEESAVELPDQILAGEPCCSKNCADRLSQPSEFQPGQLRPRWQRILTVPRDSPRHPKAKAKAKASLAVG